MPGEITRLSNVCTLMSKMHLDAPYGKAFIGQVALTK